MAFTSTKPELQAQVEAYTHLLARLMSLLMCCGLQQVSPCRDRPFEIIDLDGIEPASMEFLNQAPDKVEILLQWIQRSMVLHVQTGVLPVAPPILSRAFQEVSRGIVNLQNARKIADFPYPYPLAQVSMILQMLHWAMTPLLLSLALPRGWAVIVSFTSIFTLWCLHFNALDLEFPFGTRVNDLPMHEMQQDWNKSVCTLLCKRASRPPVFTYEKEMHQSLSIAMSDASPLYQPTNSPNRIKNRQSVATIRLSTRPKMSSEGPSAQQVPPPASGSQEGARQAPAPTPPSANSQASSAAPSGAVDTSLAPPAAPRSVVDVPQTSMAPPPRAIDLDASSSGAVPPSAAKKEGSGAVPPSAAPSGLPADRNDRLQTLSDVGLLVQRAGGVESGGLLVQAVPMESAQIPGGVEAGQVMQSKHRPDLEEKLDEKAQLAWEKQLADVCTRMKELHSGLIDEERRLMESLTRRAAKPSVVLQI